MQDDSVERKEVALCADSSSTLLRRKCLACIAENGLTYGSLEDGIDIKVAALGLLASGRLLLSFEEVADLLILSVGGVLNIELENTGGFDEKIDLIG